MKSLPPEAELTDRYWHSLAHLASTKPEGSFHLGRSLPDQLVLREPPFGPFWGQPGSRTIRMTESPGHLQQIHVNLTQKQQSARGAGLRRASPGLPIR